MARLEKRRRLYYAVRDIPKGCQKKLGKRRFLRSTGTGDRAKAELIAASFDVVWLEKIDRARNGPPKDISKEESEARLHRQAAFWRDRINNAAPSSRPLVIEQMKDAASQELDPYDPEDPEGVERAELFVELALGEHVALDEQVEAFLAEKSKDAKPKTIDLYRTSLARFCDRFPRSSDVTTQTVRQWVRELRNEGVADNTLQRTFSAVRGYWRYLQDSGVLAEGVDPFAGVLRISEKGRNRRGKAQPYRAFEPAEVVKLLRAAEAKRDNQLVNLIYLGMWTGCRIESLCSLKVADVSKDAIRVSDKTEAGDRLVPIHQQLRPKIETLCSSSSDGYVLSGLSPNKYGDRSNAVGKRFGRLKDAFGFNERCWGFHSIRKTVVTQLQRAGVPEDVTMAIVGHENSSITYGLYSAGPSLEQKREAIDKLSYPGI